MIDKITISGIQKLYKPDFIKKNNINKIISFVDPNVLDEFYNYYQYNIGINWDYFVFYDTNLKEGYDYPKEEHIKKLIEIYNKLIKSETQYNCHIHCMAGISRSTAAGYILLYLLYNDYKKALDELLNIRDIACPNLLMLEYADNILGTKMHCYIKKWINNTEKGKILMPYSSLYE